jgi:hypothetical protein
MRSGLDLSEEQGPVQQFDLQELPDPQSPDLIEFYVHDLKVDIVDGDRTEAGGLYGPDQYLAVEQENRIFFLADCGHRREDHSNT